MKTDKNWLTCGCFIIILVLNVLFGAWSVNYLLTIFLDKAIPFIGAAVIGMIAGEITIPVAVVVLVLHTFGVL